MYTGEIQSAVTPSSSNVPRSISARTPSSVPPAREPDLSGGSGASGAQYLADARDQLVPAYSTATLQFGVSSNDGWDAALVIRNLFDEDKGGYLSSSDYGEFFGDPRFRFRPSPQRPRSISLSFTKKW